MASAKKALKVPELPESVADATVIVLHKKAGDVVRRDELLAELETDKVVLEVPSPINGILESWVVEESAVVEADALLGYLVEEVSAVATTVPTAAPAAGTTSAPTAAPAAGTTSTPTAAPAPGVTSTPTAAPAPGTTSVPMASPGVRRMLQEHGLSAGNVEGTGPSGRLLREDVERHLQGKATTEAARAATQRLPADGPATPIPRGASVASAAVETSGPEEAESSRARRDERVPMTRLRARIAERLLRAKQETAMLTTFNEVDLSAVMDLRNRHKDAFEKKYGTRLGFMGFFVAASAAALGRFPIINAEIDGSDVVHHNYIDIGIAVSSPRGLVVPVLRDADRLGIAEVERRIRDFGDRAREGRLDLNELRGGTFTITNGGVFGSMLSTPILNPPQSAILGMHAIQDRPVARDGLVVIRPMMYLALSYDHRLIDGSDAVRFLIDIRNSLEDPARLLLNI
jgi:2-oxoglutarate dehydrogenase E2 component (dihydrolipoamide succinyltransferase)